MCAEIFEKVEKGTIQIEEVLEDFVSRVGCIHADLYVHQFPQVSCRCSLSYQHYAAVLYTRLASTSCNTRTHSVYAPYTRPTPLPLLYQARASSEPTQRALAVPTVPLYPSFYLGRFASLCAQHRGYALALVRLVKEPVLVLCFDDFLLDAVDDTECYEQVVPMGAEVLTCAVQTARRVDGGRKWC